MLLFCAAGAIGQNFIFTSLQRYGSLMNVTITITRKFLTILISVSVAAKAFPTADIDSGFTTDIARLLVSFRTLFLDTTSAPCSKCALPRLLSEPP
jgi:hypothetical protein